MIKNNKNKGFSFIELIIVVAILSIVMIMVSKFMSSTLNTYTRTNADNKVQANAQETYDKIANHMMMAQSVKLSTTNIEIEEVTGKRKISTGEVISETRTPYLTYSGDMEMGKNIDETCIQKEEDIYIDSNTGLLRYYTAGGSSPMKSVNGIEILPFKTASSTTVEKNAAADLVTTITKIATIDTTALNILYEDNERYYVAKYYFVEPTVGEPQGKLYLKIEDTGLLLADEYAGNEAEQLVYKKKKLLAAGTVDEAAVAKPEYLLCNGVGNFTIVTDGNGNSLGVNIEFVNRNRTYKSKGMISIRNTNVLCGPEKK